MTKHETCFIIYHKEDFLMISKHRKILEPYILSAEKKLDKYYGEYKSVYLSQAAAFSKLAQQTETTYAETVEKGNFVNTVIEDNDPGYLSKDSFLFGEGNEKERYNVQLGGVAYAHLARITLREKEASRDGIEKAKNEVHLNKIRTENYSVHIFSQQVTDTKIRALVSIGDFPIMYRNDEGEYVYERAEAMDEAKRIDVAKRILSFGGIVNTYDWNLSKFLLSDQLNVARISHQIEFYGQIKNDSKEYKSLDKEYLDLAENDYTNGVSKLEEAIEKSNKRLNVLAKVFSAIFGVALAVALIATVYTCSAGNFSSLYAFLTGMAVMFLFCANVLFAILVKLNKTNCETSKKEFKNAILARINISLPANECRLNMLQADFISTVTPVLEKAYNDFSAAADKMLQAATELCENVRKQYDEHINYMPEISDLELQTVYELMQNYEAADFRDALRRAKEIIERNKEKAEAAARQERLDKEERAHRSEMLASQKRQEEAAKKQAEYAREQAELAKEQAEYAREQAKYQREQAAEAAKQTEYAAKVAEIERERNARERSSNK